MDRGSPDLRGTLRVSKRIELDYSLVENGRATTPPSGDFSALLNLFPNTFAAEVFPPFLVIRVRTLPPRPWPFTVAGLPVRFTTDEWAGCFDHGKGGKGRKILEQFDLQNRNDFSDQILKQTVEELRKLNVKVRDVLWFAGFWQITVPDGTDLNDVPSFIASHRAFYKFVSEVPDPDPSALRSRVPQGIQFDDSLYVNSPDALLRPGIMLSSSIRTVSKHGKNEEVFKTTSSGILVVNRHGEMFITVATHGFEEDGLVYHPDPHKGMVIGKIVQNLPGTDISLAKLNAGLRYTNETFGTKENPGGVRINGISPGYPPHLRNFDSISMDNPFSGNCEGTVLALGARVPEEENTDFVRHEWYLLEKNGDEPIDGGCGCPILDSDGRVVGLFRFKLADSHECVAVSAMELRRFDYEICGGEQTF